MPLPNHGALGTAFTVMRGLQTVSLIAIIGMTANFISDMVESHHTPPNVLVGTLSVVRISSTQAAAAIGITSPLLTRNL